MKTWADFDSRASEPYARKARPGLSRTVTRGIEREAERRAGPFADDAERLDAIRAVMDDLGVWMGGWVVWK